MIFTEWHSSISSGSLLNKLVRVEGFERATNASQKRKNGFIAWKTDLTNVTI